MMIVLPYTQYVNTLINNVKREKSRPADDSGVSAGVAPLSLTEELH